MERYINKYWLNIEHNIEKVTAIDLTLAELHVCVLTSILNLTKLLQNLMKRLPNHIMVW